MVICKSPLPENTDDLTCLWCNKLFTCPVTLGCGHSLCWACAVRVRNRKIKPRCRYQNCGMKIRDIKFVVNQTLDKVAKRAKISKNPPKDENGGDSEVEGRSVGSSCSIDSMKPPPYMSPDRTPESGLFPSKTAGTCDAGETCVSMNTEHEGSVHTANGPLDKKNTEARRSVPVSSSSSDGDSGCKETPSGDPGSDSCYKKQYVGPLPKLEIGPDLSNVYSVGNSNTSEDELGGDSGVEDGSVSSSCSISSMYPPPNMSPARISDVELLSSKTASSDVCSVVNSGGEEFKHPAQAEPPRVTVVSPDHCHFLITSI